MDTIEIRIRKAAWSGFEPEIHDVQGLTERCVIYYAVKASGEWVDRKYSIVGLGSSQANAFQDAINRTQHYERTNSDDWQGGSAE